MPKVTFIESDGTEHPVTAPDGISLMRAAVENEIPGVIAICGGAMTCATCHVYIDEAWEARVGAPSEDEKFMLEYALEPRPNSRLSCQVILGPSLDGLLVHVPGAQADS
jgi:ferredoxin, 2Fe-2S